MARVVKDAAEIVGEIIDDIIRTFVITKSTDLGGSPSSYRLDTCDTLWLRPCKDLIIDGNTYNITSFVLNQSITIQEVTVGAGEPTVEQFILPAPLYIHGTPVAAALQQKEEELPQDRTPFIYLREVVVEGRNRDEDNPIGNIINARLFFLDEAVKSDQTPEQYVDVIRPMDQLLEAFVDVIKEQTGKFATEDPPLDYDTIAHARHGIEKSDFGHVKKIFDETLSGRELIIDIPVSKSACIDCFSNDIIECTITVNVTGTDPTILDSADGTTTANISGNQGNITFLWTTSDGVIPPGEETKQTMNGLVKGTYIVTVDDDIIGNCDTTGQTTLNAGLDILGFTYTSINAEDTTFVIVYSGTGTPSATDGVQVLTGTTFTFNWTDAGPHNVVVTVDEPDKITDLVAPNWNDKGIIAANLSRLTDHGGNFQMSSNPLAIIINAVTSRVYTNYVVTFSSLVNWDGSTIDKIGGAISFRGSTLLETVVFSTTSTSAPTSQLDFTDTALKGKLDISKIDMGGTLLAANKDIDEFIGGSSNLVITEINLSGNKFPLADLSGYTKLGNTFRINNVLELENMPLPDTSESFATFQASLTGLGYFDVTSMPNMLKRNNHFFSAFSNGGFTVAILNQILDDLATLASTETAGGDHTGRRITMNGTNPAPDTTSGGVNGVAAVATLVSFGFIVDVTP